MFGQLLESRHRATRRRGGAVVSALVHGLLIAAAIAATRADGLGSARPDPEPPHHVIFSRTPAPPRRLPTTAHPDKGGFVGESIIPRTPIMIDVHFPAIEGPVFPEPILLDGAGGARCDSACPRWDRSVLDGSTGSGGAADHPLTGVDLAARLEAGAPQPRYPDALRAAGIPGEVLVRFVIDTAGRVDRKNITVLRATSSAFADAVLAVLPRYRFTPAHAHGVRVPMLAEMPFVFSLR